MSIADFKEKIKAFTKTEDIQTILYIVILVIVAISSFYLGRLSKNESIYSPEKALNEAKTVISDQSATDTQNDQKGALGDQNKAFSGGAFIAAKSGTKYYPAGCSGINKIKIENRISFQTEAEAQATGRTRSGTCH